METLLFVLLLFPPSWQTVESGTLTTETAQLLVGAYGIHFGTAQEDVIQSLSDEHDVQSVQKISREVYTVLEFPDFPLSGISKLRVFVHPEEGVFWIEEEIGLRWDLQRRDQDNLEYHQRRLEEILGRLSREYGNEVVHEDTNLGGRFEKNDFVRATWTFPENRWIHVIYEPQDWELFPERNKILVIYRDSSRDPRRN
ncbi:MAG: hypothetical protein V3U24_04970 [Candidatus Neomarinimicrobiota bacterium]